VISTLGGAIGLLLGYGIIGLAALAMPGLPVHLSLWVVLGALGFAAGVGVAAGVIPAFSAAKLDPVGARRFERRRTAARGGPPPGQVFRGPRGGGASPPAGGVRPPPPGAPVT